jgi:hypothetical protein
MTAQMNDKFIFHRKGYALSAIEFPDKFLDIYSLGFKPTEFSTACWRGYIAAFSIYKKNLVLKDLYTNNGNDLKNEAPKLNNKLPEISINENWVNEEIKTKRREFTYSDINLIIPYTGSILITRDFIRGLYVHMGFQSPFKYKTVIQLTFDNGKFKSSKNISKIAKLIRENKFKVSERNYDDDEISTLKWINDCFDLSYDIKAKELEDSG